MSEYAGIYLLDNPYFLDTSFDYFLPPDLRDSIHIGDFVTVPFGTANRHHIGLVASLKDSPDNPNLSCKPVLSVCDTYMSLSEETFGLCFFLKERTLCTLGDAVRAAIPASALSRLVAVYRPSIHADDEELDGLSQVVLDHIKKKGEITEEALKIKFGPALPIALKSLSDASAIIKEFTVRSSEDKSVIVYSLAISNEYAMSIISGEEKNDALRSRQQLSVLRAIFESENGEMTERELCDAVSVTPAPIKALCKNGFLKKEKRTIDRSLLCDFEQNVQNIVLNEEQAAAYDKLCELYDTGKPAAAL